MKKFKTNISLFLSFLLIFNLLYFSKEVSFVDATSQSTNTQVIEKEDGSLHGVAAVIDKDKSSAKLAKDLEADMLVILTAVEKVYINFNKDNQQGLDFMNLKDASKYINEGHFAKGSMLPKIEACIDFVNSSTNGKALITSLEKAKDAIEGKTGTLIYND